VEQAQGLLNRALVRPYRAASLPLLRALAALHARNRDFVAEAATYHDILQLAPTDRAALRGRVFASLRMGAPHLAGRYAEQDAEAFTPAEIRDLQQTSAGRSIKWGEVEARAGIGPRRFQATNRALAKNADVRELHRRAGAMNSLSGQRTEFDRIVALRDRMRMGEAIALYGDLKRRQVQVPAYTLAAVADAYLYQRQSKQARDLYLAALALSKNDREYPNREWQLQLFDAYIDANQFDDARQLIDQLEQDIPPLLNRGLRGVEVDNEFYEQAAIDAVRARLYADEFDASQTLLEQTLDAAPFNLDARLARGELLQFREQPRAAQEQYASVLVDDPANLFAAAGIAETALALNDLKTAKTRMQALTKTYPENREIQRVQQQLHAYQQPILTVVSEAGRSPTGGGRRGNQDWLVDALLHSGPFKQHWRAFAHTFNAESDFSNVTGTRRRIGIGGEYRAPAWQVSGELNQDQTRLDNFGVSVSAAWLPTDQWKLDLEFESNSNDIPLQASAAGIDMQALRLGMAYNHNESRSLRTNLAYAWFSDSNRRIEVGADWQERWWSGPVYKLDTRLSISASDNSLTNAVYFNPRRDFSSDIQIINEWTLWRNYRRSFKHRLIIGAGNYWQQDFGAKFSTGLRYEHEWNLDNYRSLNYGIVYERHPFDGEINERTGLFLNLTWHF
jgi:biofilm PGA synthesis protein PgaA